MSLFHLTDGKRNSPCDALARVLGVNKQLVEFLALLSVADPEATEDLMFFARENELNAIRRALARELNVCILFDHFLTVCAIHSLLFAASFSLGFCVMQCSFARENELNAVRRALARELL